MASIDSIFGEWNSPHSPGCAVGIVRDGKLIYSRGFGMADLEDSIPNSLQTVFNIGSVSKQFTAACLLLLEQQHKLSLDDDVHKYVPELPDYGHPISLRQLLNHTSGLRDYITVLYFSGVRVEDLVRPQDALDVITRQRSLNDPPGETWLYCNTGYYLASVIVERVSGEALPVFAEKNIFLPLGMTHTTWVADAKSVIPHRAVGYSPGKGGTFQTNMSYWSLTGDGGIYTTLGDLLLWDRNFYDPTVGGSALIDRMVAPGALSSGKKINYGLGQFLEKYRGLDLVRHEGEWAGYKAELLRIPSKKFSVICLCNLATMIPTQLAKHIVDVCLAGELDPPTPPPATAPPGADVPVTDEDAMRWTGFYRNPDDETVRGIRSAGGKLIYSRIPGAESPLSQIKTGEFNMLGVPASVSVVFSGSHNGHATTMAVTVDTAKPITFEYFLQERLTREDCLEYAGSYYSQELNTLYTMVASGAQVIMRVRRFDDFQLTPTIKDVFKYQDYRTVTFTRNEKGAISGFILTATRAKNIPFVRTAISEVK